MIKLLHKEAYEWHEEVSAILWLVNHLLLTTYSSHVTNYVLYLMIYLFENIKSYEV